MMLDKLTIDDFRDRLGDVFRVHADANNIVETKLAEVNALGTGVPGGRTPFSIILRSDSMSYVPQQVYEVEHADFGKIGIFLVPIGADAGGMRYEAVFT